MLYKEQRHALVYLTVVCFVMSVLTGAGMHEAGYTIEAGYFWLRQIIIWFIFPGAPLLVYVLALARARHELRKGFSIQLIILKPLGEDEQREEDSEDL